MPRKARRTPKRRGSEVSAVEQFVCEFGCLPPRDDAFQGNRGAAFALLKAPFSAPQLRILRVTWTSIRADVLRDWAAEHRTGTPWAEKVLRTAHPKS